MRHHVILIGSGALAAFDVGRHAAPVCLLDEMSRVPRDFYERPALVEFPKLAITAARTSRFIEIPLIEGIKRGPKNKEPFYRSLPKWRRRYH